MKNLLHSQRGFEAISILVVVLVVGVIGFAGYKVWQQSDAQNGRTATADLSVPVKVETKADLKQVSDVLDDSLSQLDASLSGEVLSKDIDSLL